ncbi:MAG: hypothetical protein WDM77_06445 [Steroidobacteraceae bacterium]
MGTGTNYLPVYPGDLLASTITWTGEARALLLLVSMYYWITPLSADEGDLARIIGYDAEHFRALWSTVRSVFAVENGRLLSAELEGHRARATRLHEQRVQASAMAVAERSKRAQRKAAKKTPTKVSLKVVKSGSPSGTPGGASNG